MERQEKKSSLMRTASEIAMIAGGSALSAFGLIPLPVMVGLPVVGYFWNKFRGKYKPENITGKDAIKNSGKAVLDGAFGFGFTALAAA